MTLIPDPIDPSLPVTVSTFAIGSAAAATAMSANRMRQARADGRFEIMKRGLQGRCRQVFAVGIALAEVDELFNHSFYLFVGRTHNFGFVPVFRECFAVGFIFVL